MSPAWRMSRSVSPCSPRLPPLPSSISSTLTRETLRRDCASRSFQYRRDQRRYVFLLRGDGWPFALSGLAHPSACLDQGRQSRPWSGRARPDPARRWRTFSTQTDRHLGFGSALRRLDLTTDWARAEARSQMSLLPILDVVLASLVIGVAIFTISARELFASVVGYVAYGLLLAFVWIRLYAPDVALTEAAVGSGVTGVLLITAGKRLGALKNAAPEAQPGFAFKLLTGVLAALVASALGAVILMLPDPPPSLAPEAAAAADGAGAGLGNPITAVLMSYRSLDTML